MYKNKKIFKNWIKIIIKYKLKLNNCITKKDNGKYNPERRRK